MEDLNALYTKVDRVVFHVELKLLKENFDVLTHTSANFTEFTKNSLPILKIQKLFDRYQFEIALISFW